MGVVDIMGIECFDLEEDSWECEEGWIFWEKLFCGMLEFILIILIGVIGVGVVVIDEWLLLWKELLLLCFIFDGWENDWYFCGG